MAGDARHVVWFEEITRRDVPRVGGKNALVRQKPGGGDNRQQAQHIRDGVSNTSSVTYRGFWCYMAAILAAIGGRILCFGQRVEGAFRFGAGGFGANPSEPTSSSHAKFQFSERWS